MGKGQPREGGKFPQRNCHGAGLWREELGAQAQMGKPSHWGRGGGSVHSERGQPWQSPQGQGLVLRTAESQAGGPQLGPTFWSSSSQCPLTGRGPQGGYISDFHLDTCSPRWVAQAVQPPQGGLPWAHWTSNEQGN